VIQTNLNKWLSQNDNDSRDDGFSDECSFDPVGNINLIPNQQKQYDTVCNRNIVADGTHQCDTANTCLLVR
jgi:hypothetical protein